MADDADIRRLRRRIDAVLDHLASDKKHAAGRLRWVLPTADGVVVRDDVPVEVVSAVVAGILAGTPVSAGVPGGLA